MRAIETYGLEEHTADLPLTRFPPSADLLAEPSGSGEEDSAVAGEEGHRGDEGAEIAPTNGAGEVRETGASASVTTAGQSEPMTAAGLPLFSPATRKEAIFLLDEAARYLRAAEPQAQFRG
jgi:hypothetical protein